MEMTIWCKCKGCNGTGKISAYKYMKELKRIISEMVECPVCDGEKVEKIHLDGVIKYERSSEYDETNLGI
jgi:DnaJ-class molecular chaperone